jgi:UDP-N-acetyl-D-galactosamine dehydrogenase
VAAASEARHEYNVELVSWDDLPRAGAIVAAVAHRPLLERSADELLGKLLPGGVYADVKSSADVAVLEAQGVKVWRL